MIKVLIAEDSPTLRELLAHILGSDPAIRVIGTVADGEQAVEAVMRIKPDVVTMDVHMPKIDGFEATRRIMGAHPVPIVIVSGTLMDQVTATFRAMEAGALAFVRRPSGIGHPDHDAAAAELVQTVKLMAEVKVVRRWTRPLRTQVGRDMQPRTAVNAPADLKLVAIGASTGGPVAIQGILSALPKRLRVPVLIVQHIATGFVRGFADWLAQSCGLPVHVATHGESPLPGHAYVAPEDSHMGVERGPRVVLSNTTPENGSRPSVSYLFRSVAEKLGPDAVGVLLTGMGKDGAEELKLMKDRGAVTIAQDAQSSVVHGMPGEAIKLGAALHVLPADRIAAMVASLLSDDAQQH